MLIPVETMIKCPREEGYIPSPECRGCGYQDGLSKYHTECKFEAVKKEIVGGIIGELCFTCKRECNYPDQFNCVSFRQKYAEREAQYREGGVNNGVPRL